MAQGAMGGPLIVDMVSNGTIQHTLMKADSQPHSNLVEELDTLDPEDLEVAREELFKAAITHLEQQIKNKGISSKPQPEMKKRIGLRKDKGNKSTSCDSLALHK